MLLRVVLGMVLGVVLGVVLGRLLGMVLGVVLGMVLVLNAHPLYYGARCREYDGHDDGGLDKVYHDGILLV